MSLSEFELIERFFTGLTDPGSHTRLGIGDDAAVLSPPPGAELLLCTDTLVEDVHFPFDAPAASVGHKALAVNLSDLAAMGGTPLAALLSLTLPAVEADWVRGFCSGFAPLARAHGVDLIGGDITRGPLSITVQALGHVPAGAALRRAGAQVGDDVYVSGTLGDAALGLRIWQAGKAGGRDADALVARLNRPTPRLALGQALLGLANAAIDLSDGLVADAAHVARASGVRIELEAAELPGSAAFNALAGTDRVQLQCGGDDYELCFTAPPDHAAPVARAAAGAATAVTRIGRVTAGEGVVLRDRDGQVLTDSVHGYRHFEDGRGG